MEWKKNALLLFRSCTFENVKRCLKVFGSNLLKEEDGVEALEYNGSDENGQVNVFGPENQMVL